MQRYTIIVPVFGALKQVKACLESVLENTSLDHHVLVIDDASPDGDTLRYLRKLKLERPERLTVIYHQTNMGFIRTANEGMRWALANFSTPILLNSDAVVPPQWVERMDEARMSNPKCCSVSPLSNECTLFSVPNAWSNDLPPGLSVDDIDRIVEQTSERKFPSVLTNIGFCMLLTGPALAAVGFFDTVYGRGYADETDWTLRARALGFECVLCDTLYVYHEHHASFTRAERDKLGAINEPILLERFPEYRAEADAYFRSQVQRTHRQRIAEQLRPRPLGKPRPRLLYVLHHWGQTGGCELLSRAIADAASGEFEVTVMYPNFEDSVADSVTYFEDNGMMRIVMSPRLVGSEVMVGLFRFANHAPDVEAWFEKVLEVIEPDVVHFDHVAGYGTFALPAIAAKRSKVVMSIHDEFLLCPLMRLAEDCDQPRCTNCAKCVGCIESNLKVWATDKTKDGGVKLDIPAMLDERAELIFQMGLSIERAIYPSKTIMHNVPTGATCELIPHGVPRFPVVWTYRPRDVLRVAWVGTAHPKKGWDCFAAVARALGPSSSMGEYRVEFSVIGGVEDACECHGLERVKFLGKYQRKDLAQLLQSVDLAIPAVARNEAYGLVIDDCAAANCPMLLPDIPMLRDRLPSFKVWYAFGDAEDLRLEVEDFCELLDDNRIPWPRTIEQCTADYLELYRVLLSRPTEEGRRNWFDAVAKWGTEIVVGK